MATPHIRAEKGDFAPTVIMSGDPLRAKLIAEKFFDNPRLVNNVRSVQGYTGKYQGKAISVMAHGMGMPSMAIYAHELYEYFGVTNIIRAGSAGALADSLSLRDLIVAETAYTDSNIVNHLGSENSSFRASPTLLSLAREEAVKLEKKESKIAFGKIFTSDLFYSPVQRQLDQKIAGALAVEMETVALYAIAKQCGRNALALLTVSDFALTGEGLNAEDRERTFMDMINLALNIANKI